MTTILLDIEGTTTSISFVKDVLFPFARKEMEKFLKLNWNDESVQSILNLVRIQSQQDLVDGVITEELPEVTKDADLPQFVKYLKWQMDQDRKTTGLKALQGKIWKSGYEKGELKGHVYDDVPKAFDLWIASGKKIYIYSSGSVEAQILLFKCSVAGDLTKFLSGHFDTTTGPKVEASSYSKIAEKVGVSPGDILFFTDVPKEAYAAKEAGMQVAITIRQGNAPLSDQERTDFKTIENFD